MLAEFFIEKNLVFKRGYRYKPLLDGPEIYKCQQFGTISILKDSNRNMAVSIKVKKTLL